MCFGCTGRECGLGSLVGLRSEEVPVPASISNVDRVADTLALFDRMWPGPLQQYRRAPPSLVYPESMLESAAGILGYLSDQPQELIFHGTAPIFIRLALSPPPPTLPTHPHCPSPTTPVPQRTLQQSTPPVLAAPPLPPCRYPDPCERCRCSNAAGCRSPLPCARQCPGVCRESPEAVW